MLPRPMSQVEQVKVVDVATAAIIGVRTLGEAVVSPAMLLERMSLALHGGVPKTPFNKATVMFKVEIMTSSNRLLTRQ